jgi:hypothetical protein
VECGWSRLQLQSAAPFLVSRLPPPRSLPATSAGRQTPSRNDKQQVIVAEKMKEQLHIKAGCARSALPTYVFRRVSKLEDRDGDESATFWALTVVQTSVGDDDRSQQERRTTRKEGSR